MTDSTEDSKWWIGNSDTDPLNEDDAEQIAAYFAGILNGSTKYAFNEGWNAALKLVQAIEAGAIPSLTPESLEHYQDQSRDLCIATVIKLFLHSQGKEGESSPNKQDRDGSDASEAAVGLLIRQVNSQETQSESLTEDG